MAFGFGFNKQKVLGAAEKYVQQGKLQNAITEYEKILKNDAKDLTVTNTVGDLYARLGENDKATECFKTVGDAYAAQGFTVKGIAMYKKITKISPSVDGSLKLAELYTQQGLFNDARAQYLQVAEDFMKNGDLDQAVRQGHVKGGGGAMRKQEQRLQGERAGQTHPGDHARATPFPGQDHGSGSTQRQQRRCETIV